MAIRKYWSSACPKCPIRGDCTTGDYRRIMRWEHEAVIDAHAAPAGSHAAGGKTATPDRRAYLWHAQIVDGLNALPDAAVTERANGDEPAGSGINLKRVIQILGVQPLIAAMRA